jgi:soluble lytic murein transglycosylase-like protein
MKTALILLALFWALLLLCVPSRPGNAASTTEKALTALCPGREHLAPHVDAAARRYMVHRKLLVALIAHESRCRVRASSGKGDYGLGQIRITGSAARGATIGQLFDPSTNLMLAARHLSRCFTLCGSLNGLSVYSGRKKCSPSRYSAAVVRKFERLFIR